MGQGWQAPPRRIREVARLFRYGQPYAPPRGSTLSGYTSLLRNCDDFFVHRRISVSVVAVVGLGLPGSALAAPTKAQFIRQGDALCSNVQRELAPLRRQAEVAQSLPEAQKWGAAARLWTAQIQIQRRFVARFRALGLPAGDSRARGLVVGLDRGLALAVRVRNAFAARSTNGLATALPAYLRFTLSLNRRVAAYGFRVCGR